VQYKTGINGPYCIHTSLPWAQSGKGSHFQPHVPGGGGCIDCAQIKTATRRPPLPICAMVLA